MRHLAKLTTSKLCRVAVMELAIAFHLTAQANANQPSQNFSLKCASDGAFVLTQYLSGPFESADSTEAFLLRSIQIDVEQMNDPVLSVFSGAPEKRLFTVDLSVEEGRLFRFIAHSFADEPPDGSSGRIILYDEVNGGSSFILSTAGSGRWKGRVISTEGLVEGKAYDRTLYVALTCESVSSEVHLQ